MGLADRLAPSQAEERPVSIERPLVTFDDLRIWTRDNPPRLVPLTPNTVQAHYLDSLAAHYGFDPAKPWELRGAREDIVKARQQGFSTFWLALYYTILYNSEYSQTVIITNHAKSTEMLWGRVQMFEEELRENCPEKARPIKYSSRRELMFSDTGSSLFIGTAGQDDLTRSGTITNAHLTEIPSWEVEPGKVLTPLLGTLPEWGNLTFESTAGGLGPHYDAYVSHRDDPATGYRAIFYGWDWTPEYTAPVPSDFQRTTEEAGLIAHRTGEPLTDGQLVWRRRRWAEYRAQGREHEAAQEFPLTDDEAFLSSVTNAFFADKLSAFLIRLHAYWSATGPNGDLLRPPIDRIKPGDGQLCGTLEVYEQFDPDDAFVIGADVAKGVVKGIKGERRDYSTFDVVSRKTWRHVASYWGREGCPPDAFGGDLATIGGVFNDALIIVEANNHGILTLDELVKRQKYPNVYYRKVNQLSEEGVLIENDEAGFDTNEGSKAAAYGYLRRMISQCAAGYGKLFLRGPRAIKELANLGNLPGGKIGALAGHDDHGTSLALCAVVLEERPYIGDEGFEPNAPAATAGGWKR